MRRVVTALGLVLAAAVSGCGQQDDVGSSPPRTPGPAPVESRSDERDLPVRMAVVGDSITQADGDVPAGLIGPSSWVSTAVGGDVEFAGGWARGGATTADMLAAVSPVDADVLVVLAGTNDPGAGLSGAQSAANIQGIVDRMGVDRVVLSAVPPRDAVPQTAVATNTLLADLAREQGWVFADSSAGLRAGDRFAPGMSADGLHPSRRGSAVIGAALQETVLEVAGR